MDRLKDKKAPSSGFETNKTFFYYLQANFLNFSAWLITCKVVSVRNCQFSTVTPCPKKLATISHLAGIVYIIHKKTSEGHFGLFL